VERMRIELTASILQTWRSTEKNTLATVKFRISMCHSAMLATVFLQIEQLA